MVRKREIAFYKQFLLFHNVFHSFTCITLVRQNAVLSGNGLRGLTNRLIGY